MILTTAGFTVLQLCIFAAFALPFAFQKSFCLLFFGTSLTFHGCIYILLRIFKNDFVIELTGERLTKINSANIITLFRITTLPTLLFLVMAARDHSIRSPLLFLVVAVFCSDFLDGYVSRKTGQVTRVGKMMDSASDYCLIAVLTVVFAYYGLIPGWLFWFVIMRLFLQTVLMTFLIRIQRKIEPKSTFMGKVAVASIMVVYSTEILELVIGSGVTPLVNVLEYTSAGILAASMIDKLILFVHEQRRSLERDQHTEL